MKSNYWMLLQVTILPLAFLAYHPTSHAAGVAVAWGDNQAGQTNPCAASVLGIATGYMQTLLLKSDGTVVNCGMHWEPPANEGDPWTHPIVVPSGLSNVVAVAGGYSHSLALKSDGTVVAWGRNTYGQTDIPGMTNVVAVSASDYHNLALRSDGTVVAWGGSATYHTNVPSGLSNVVAIAAGTDNLALKSDGTVVGWGPGTALPDQMAALSNIVAVSSGWATFGGVGWLALKSDGTLAGAAPPGLTNVVGICASSGTDHHINLAIHADGTVSGWGFNFYGGPIVPAGLTNAIAVASDSTHCVALIGDAPPILSTVAVAPSLVNGGFTLSIPSQSGKVYRLEFKESLSDSDWISLPLVAGSGHLLTLTDPEPSDTQRFYRVRQW